MEQKKRITIFNVAIAQLTSALMLPILWILVGSIAQAKLFDAMEIDDTDDFIAHMNRIMSKAL
jgi:hypothetical protein